MEVTVETGFVAFDYGVLGWIWNPKWRGFSGSSVPEPPRRWRDLLRPEWKKKLLLQDPRTSSPGLGVVLGVREAVGDDFSRFFSALRAQWVTLAPGWSGAYGLFLKDQAPLVWSYTTSQAYHRQQDPQAPYQALVFDEGNPLQIEGALAIEKAVDSPESLALAKRFLEFLVSTEVQALVPQKQWMLPARKGVKLPRSFRGIPQPKKQWILGVQSDLSTVLREWETAIR
jgi:thiamine transport system substrate-binding protein